MSKFSKVSGYKINVQKLVVFLCITNKLSEREFKKAISFVIVSETMKYLGIN